MKWLRKTVRLAIAWICVCLLLVDPAAACRLLAGRRCCCPCSPVSCNSAADTATTTGAAPLAPEDSAGIAAAPEAVPTAKVEVNPAVEEVRPLEVVEPPAHEPTPAVEPVVVTPVQPLPAQPATSTEATAAEGTLALPVRETPPPLPQVDIDPVLPTPPTKEAPKQPEPDPDDPFAPLPPRSPKEQKGAAAPATNSTRCGEEVSLTWRQWNDESGQFRVKARLVLVLEGNVRLLKETGRTTTVPLERLSASDRTYVSEVVAQYGKDLAAESQFAQLDTYRRSSE
jgi:hypothetical protein